MSEIQREHVVGLPDDRPYPRTCIFAAFNEKYAPIADIARPNWTAYARRHGYGLRFYPQGWHNDPSRPQTYGDKGRFQWYYDLRGLCDLIVYIDIDSLFTNMGMPVSALPTRPFLWTYSDGGPQSGLWIARTDETTEKHLRYAYEYAAAENNVRHGKIEPNGISDQDAMTRLMHVPPFNRTFENCVSAEGIYCSPAQWKPGAWMVQFGGMSFEEKLAAMQQWSSHAVAAR